jgi:hypothetical protein
MPYPIKTCQCKGLGDPTPRFCRDDLFCPQCGLPVAWIDSDHLLPFPEPAGGGAGRPVLWVYRREEDDGRSTYELTLDFFEVDPLGGIRNRPLELTAAGCLFEAPGFDPQPGITAGGASRAALQLVPLDPNDLLPVSGVRGRLTLAGNCGVVGQVLAGRPGDHDSLDVFVFNKPVFSTTVVGEGVQEELDSRDTWQLWKDGPQELTVQVEPTEAQVFLALIGPKPSWPIEEDPNLPVRVTERPNASAIYGPNRPAVVALRLDPHSWQPQEIRILKLQLDFALDQSLKMNLSLKRQAEGMLVWSTGNDLVVPPMFYGETVATPPVSPLLPEISVSNAGTTPLPAQMPRIADGASLRGIRWIEAGWADGTEKFAILDQGDSKSKSLRLAIDLSEVTPDNHHEGDPLKAEVIVQHVSFGMIWKLGVTVRSVGHRPALEAPLALDFGNTNSYGSAELPGARRTDPIAVRSILGRTDDPETFASALAFRDLDDEAHPDYEIGREALELGKDQPLRLERGLKRSLSMLRPVADKEGNLLDVAHEGHPFNKRRFIYPRDGGEPAQFSLRDLVRLYLLAAIERCETGERRTVTQLGLSYPANLGPEPRRALNLVIKDVEAECKARHPDRAAEIAFRPLGPDEASAVALGFVLDPDTLRQRIIPLYHDGRASFALASFDFGGGSVDIALIRFDLDGLPPLTSFSSALLGLGGDEHFGGDNVTVAAYEILASRIAQALGSQRRLPLAPLDVHRNRADPRGWANRQALWGAAEVAKRAACRDQPSAARGEIATALEGLHADDRAALGVIAAELEGGRLDVPLAEIYEHVIECDLSGVGQYRVADRLRGCVRMLREFADRAGPDSSPRFLVLAGAACRVPLARELLRAEFPDAVIVPEEEVIPDSYRPKSKVADGLARFLRASRGGASDARVRGLKPAHLFTHADLLWINPIQSSYPVVWVPSCVELRGGPWHLLRIDDDARRVVPLIYAWSRPEVMEIDVHRRASPEPELVGTARLAGQADFLEQGVTPHLPEPSPELDRAEILLRIDGEEDRLRLRIRIDGEEFGDWKVLPVPAP